MSIKKYIVAIISLCAAFQLTAQTPYGSGTRVDFFDLQGNRISSKIIQPDDKYSFFKASVSSGDVNITDGRGLYVSEMRFIPWGVESYSVKVTSVGNDYVESWIEYMDDEGMFIGGEDKLKEINLKCGVKFRIYVEVPDKTYPKLGVLDEYSGVYINEDNERVENRYSCSYFPTTTIGWQRLGIELTDPDWRQAQIDILNQFKRSEDNPNRWYVDWEMGNQPISFTASCIKPDGKLLDNYVDAAMMSLYCQGYDWFSNNSVEGFTQLMYGELLSQDQISNQAIAYGTDNIYELMMRADSSPNCIGWINYMGVVTIANYNIRLLNLLHFATEQEKQIALAKLLVLRSHAYWRLLQIYAPRWEDSDEGKVPCVPLETSFIAENPDISTMREIIDQCYKDLDQAIATLSQQSANLRRSFLDPTVDVARGVKLRLAMLSHDWKKVDELSSEILNNYSISSNEEYLSGFINPTSSWIWAACNNSQNPEVENPLYYWSWQNSAACNGTYPSVWQMGAGAIDKELYDCLDNRDVRKSLFVMKNRSNSEQSMYNSLSYSDVNKLFQNFSRLDLSDLFINYHGEKLKAFKWDEDHPNFRVPVAFGAQHKFYMPSNALDDASIPLMRAEEILLSKAEAAYHLGDMATASDCFNQLNKIRVPGAENLASGEDLLNEIIKARRIELWGEGFNWFDFKRWNKSIERKPWVEGDIKSGNWPPILSHSLKLATSDMNGWRCLVPAYYVKQNPKVDISKFRYNVSDYSAPANAVKNENSSLKNKDPKEIQHRKLFQLSTIE